MRFHLDEHVADAIAQALRRRGIDVTTTVDTRLQEASDIDHIAFGNRERRTIFTMDDDFLALADSGVQHCGIVYCHPGTRTMRQIIEYLILMDSCLTEEEMRNRVEFC